MKNNLLVHCLVLVCGLALWTSCNKDNDASPGENILFQDNFDNNNDNRWPVGKHDEVGADFKIEDGHYVIKNNRATTFYMGINRFTPPATDSLAFEMKARLDSSALQSPDYGIWLYREQPTSSIAAFYINEKGQYSIVVVKTESNGDATTKYKKNWTASSAIRPGQYNTMRIERRGGIYTFLVNGKQVDQTADLGNLGVNLPAMVVGPLAGILVDDIRVVQL